MSEKALGGMIICLDESQMKRVALFPAHQHAGARRRASLLTCACNNQYHYYLAAWGNEKARRSGWVGYPCVVVIKILVINISSPLSRHALLAQRPWIDGSKLLSLLSKQCEPFTRKNNCYSFLPFQLNQPA